MVGEVPVSLHVFEPPTGGVPEYCRRLVRSLRQIGATAYLAGPSEATGIDVAIGLDRRRPASWISRQRELDALVLELDVEVLHLHSFFAGVAGRLFPRSVPVLYQPHAWVFSSSGRLRGLAGEVGERGLKRRAQGFAFVSEAEARRAARIGGVETSRVIGTGVDTEVFRPHGPVPTEALRLTDEGLLLVCVGRIAEQKGQRELVAAWRRRSPTTATLALVGPASERDKRELSGEGVVVVGETSDTAGWLRAADVSLQPSLWEGLSLVTIEALASGTPSVVFDVDGMREAMSLVGPRRLAGGIVPVGDFDGMLEMALTLAPTPPAERDGWSPEELHAVASDRYGLRSLAVACSALYREVVAC